MWNERGGGGGGASVHGVITRVSNLVQNLTNLIISCTVQNGTLKKGSIQETES